MLFLSIVNHAKSSKTIGNYQGRSWMVLDGTGTGTIILGQVQVQGQVRFFFLKNRRGEAAGDIRGGQAGRFRCVEN